MIYETAFVVKADAPQEAVEAAKALVADTIKQFGGETLINDAWGVKTFAQPTETGIKKGNFFYTMYKGPGTINAELDRRFGISEDVVRFMIVRLGDDADQDAIAKGYKNPNHAAVAATGEAGEEMEDGDKEKRMHSKRKSCWFSAKKTSPDWKDPKSYSWLVNEFGKISPARITGLTPKFQRKACDAIKRGRMMGLISYTSNEVAR